MQQKLCRRTQHSLYAVVPVSEEISLQCTDIKYLVCTDAIKKFFTLCTVPMETKDLCEVMRVNWQLLIHMLTVLHLLLVAEVGETDIYQLHFDNE
jgi:hypothetical protein